MYCSQTHNFLDAKTEFFGSGCGAIFFDNVECEGMEERLELCSKAVFGNCDHTHDAGVRCALSSEFEARNFCIFCVYG